MMRNAERYNFSDFTRTNYRRLLNLAKKNYIFRNFTDYREDERFVIWRHDIDFSAHAARNLALIEFEEGIRATYFVLLHSEFYNLLEREITDCIHDILSHGHYLGLHLDSRYYELNNDKHLAKVLLFEKKIIEEIFACEIKVFSFHITTPFALHCVQPQYVGLINAHAGYFRNQIGYCSDSNGYWRFRRLEEVLSGAKDERLQVLTHPEMWQESIMSPRQRVYRCIDGRALKTKNWYDTILKDYGRENIDWD